MVKEPPKRIVLLDSYRPETKNMKGKKLTKHSYEHRFM